MAVGRDFQVGVESPEIVEDRSLEKPGIERWRAVQQFVPSKAFLNGMPDFRDRVCNTIAADATDMGAHDNDLGIRIIAKVSRNRR